MFEIIGKWTGPTWFAILTLEPYGHHFSVSAQGREPDDGEISAARTMGLMLGYYPAVELVEVTELHREIGAINSYVRHFTTPAGARLLRGALDRTKARRT